MDQCECSISKADGMAISDILLGASEDKFQRSNLESSSTETISGWITPVFRGLGPRAPLKKPKTAASRGGNDRYSAGSPKVTQRVSGRKLNPPTRKTFEFFSNATRYMEDYREKKKTSRELGGPRELGCMGRSNTLPVTQNEHILNDGSGNNAMLQIKQCVNEVTNKRLPYPLPTAYNRSSKEQGELDFCIAMVSYANKVGDSQTCYSKDPVERTQRGKTIVEIPTGGDWRHDAVQKKGILSRRKEGKRKVSFERREGDGADQVDASRNDKNLDWDTDNDPGLVTAASHRLYVKGNTFYVSSGTNGSAEELINLAEYPTRSNTDFNLMSPPSRLTDRESSSKTLRKAEEDKRIERCKVYCYNRKSLPISVASNAYETSLALSQQRTRDPTAIPDWVRFKLVHLNLTPVRNVNEISSAPSGARPYPDDLDHDVCPSAHQSLTQPLRKTSYEYPVKVTVDGKKYRKKFFLK